MIMNLSGELRSETSLLPVRYDMADSDDLQPGDSELACRAAIKRRAMYRLLL
jgi:hypothetical protein